MFVSGIIVGVITVGISALVGVGTFANHAAHADRFYERLWQEFDAISRELPVERERREPMERTTTTTYTTYQSPTPVPIISPVHSTVSTSSLGYNAPLTTITSSPYPPLPAPTAAVAHGQTPAQWLWS